MRLKIKNIGPIESADLELSDLTVISGANDTGKSTIGKALYSILAEPVNTLEKEIVSITYEFLRDMPRDFSKEFFIHFLEENAMDLFEDEENNSGFLSVPSRIGMHGFSIGMRRLEKLVESDPADYIEKFINYAQINAKISDDLRYSLDYFSKLSSNPLGLKNVVIKDMLRAEYDSVYKNKFEDSSKIELLGDGIEIYFNDTNELIYENSKYTNVIYYEPKMDFNLDYPIRYKNKYQFGIEHNTYLRRYKPDAVRIKSIYSDEINIINRMFDDLEIKKVKNGKYQLEDKELPYTAVATGIKNLIGLRKLVEEGYLTRSTLLIIDEPETALHPLWQVSYMKILKKIKECFNLDIILVTHSNYIIEASEELFKGEMKLYLATRGSEVEYEECTNASNKVYNALGAAYEQIDKLQ